jgi:membrane protein implicated in regulation of membrane protease activity
MLRRYKRTNDPSDALNKAAIVVSRVPGGNSPGEVQIRIRGGTECYMAYADQPIEVGTQVVVVADRGARSLFVASF